MCSICSSSSPLQRVLSPPCSRYLSRRTWLAAHPGAQEIPSNPVNRAPLPRAAGNTFSPPTISHEITKMLGAWGEEGLPFPSILRLPGRRFYSSCPPVHLHFTAQQRGTGPARQAARGPLPALAPRGSCAGDPGKCRGPVSKGVTPGKRDELPCADETSPAWAAAGTAWHPACARWDFATAFTGQSSMTKVSNLEF